MRTLLAALLVLAAAGADAGPRPASGGEQLFRALESAPLALVARVGTPRALDDGAYAAELVPRRVLRGDTGGAESLSIAWEELARSRPVRFEGGETLLLALEALPGASIWGRRIPDPRQRVRTLTIAERGGAFVRNPSAGSIRLVEHFLALPPELRDANPGVAHLIRLAEGARPVLARAALERLLEVRGLDAALDEVSAARLVSVLLREPPELGGLVLALVERERPERLRGALAFRAPEDGSGPARAYHALGLLDGALDPQRAAALWQRDDSSAHRAVAARFAARGQEGRLARRLRDDPAAEVRAAAVQRLAELEGSAALDRLLFAMEDGDPQVRRAALQAVAALGDAAVPGLRRVVDTGRREAAQTAVGALRMCGPRGIAALREVAATHPDESVRTLARAALGGSIGHRH